MQKGVSSSLIISDNDVRYMHKAIEIAYLNITNANGGPFGAIVVNDGIIVGTGANSVTSLNDPTAHAEILAIRDACRNLNTYQLTNCELYSSCEPCPMCFGAIYWARLKKLFFACSKEDATNAGFDDSFIYTEIDKPYELRKIQNMQLLRDESLQVFDAWKRKTDRIEY